MKKKGILNEGVIKAICSMGHTDKLVVCDAGLPVPKDVEKIDLAVVKGIPAFLDVLEPILSELIVEKVILAEEIVKESPELCKAITSLVKNIPIEFVSHEEFKLISAKSRAVVRTGEFTPYANIILQSGVEFG